MQQSPEKVSVVIICKNEEKTIGQVISSAKNLTDDIIIVDSGSTDTTLEIAKKLGARCFHQDWLEYGPQKNYAISLASTDWILSLDADEVLTPDSIEEIKVTLSRPDLDRFDGFRVPRILHIGGVAITHGGFYPDSQLRLFNRQRGKFNERKVHEAVHVKGKVGHLQNPMLHFAYRDFTDYEEAMDKYARLSAEEFSTHKRSGWRTSPLNEWIHPKWTFLYRYFLRCGFKDGAHGLKANLVYKEYVRKKIAYLRSLKTEHVH